MKLKILLILFTIVILGGVAFAVNHKHSSTTSNQTNQEDINDNSIDENQEATPATPVPVTTQDINNTSHEASALGGYNVLIADRGNNRIIEVTPDKKIVWEYHFTLPKMGLGADDAFFTDNGKTIIVNLEEYHIIQMIDYASKKVIWNYGVPGKPGSKDGMLNTPDDTYKLPNGDITVADVKNCRVIEISSDKKIVRQYGEPGKCKNQNGFLNKPNGDTPLPDSHTFISNIIGKSLVELDSNWKPFFTMALPVKYPSDPQLTKAGNILISDYSYPGQILEVTREGKIVWQFDGQTGDVKLNHPSLAIELPNGNILSNDDYNHRVIVIDKQTKKIVWQYGVTLKPGNKYSQLNIPDGVDIILRSSTEASLPLPAGPILSIGEVSRHTQNYVDKSVTMTGYVLEQQNGYAIFSDESGGKIGAYDLPVSGSGVGGLALKQKYTLQGILKYQGLSASNHNPYHLELTKIF
jgi:hypothetical protein